MKLALFVPVVLLAACNSGGCSGGSLPPYVVPSSRPVPAQPQNACDLEAANLQKLGGCGVWSASYADDCRATDQRKLADHHEQSDHTCVINAKDCATARACP